MHQIRSFLHLAKPKHKPGQNRNKSGTKPEQNRNKSGTKLEQNRNKTGTKVEQNRKKSGTKPEETLKMRGSAAYWESLQIPVILVHTRNSSGTIVSIACLHGPGMHICGTERTYSTCVFACERTKKQTIDE